MTATEKSQAVIEFNLDGTIITANDQFSQRDGLHGLTKFAVKHHRMFCEAAFTQSQEYKEFWATLSRGEYQAAEYKQHRQG